MRKNIIYALRDPRTNEIRYVGQSILGLKRARMHAMPSYLRRDQTHKGNWIRQLLKFGLMYEIVILQSVSEASLLDEAECWWINAGQPAGTLTNHAVGGGGARGVSQSPEIRKKHSDALKGRKYSTSHREKIRVASLNRSAEHKLKLQQYMSNRPSEHNQNIGKKLRGRKLSVEHKRKLRTAGRGRKHSVETREKMSISATTPKMLALRTHVWKGRKHHPETRQAMSRAAKLSWTPERKARHSLRSRGRHVSETTKQKMSAAYNRSPEAQQRRSNAQKQRWIKIREEMKFAK